MAAAEPNLRTSLTSHSGNPLPRATRTCRQSTGAPTFKALLATETPSPRSFGAMQHKVRTSQTDIQRTPAIKAVETPRTLQITACRSTRPLTAPTWTSRLRRHTLVLVRRRSTFTPPSPRNTPRSNTVAPPTPTLITYGRSGFSTLAAPDLNPSRSPPVLRSPNPGLSLSPRCEQVAATLQLTTS